MALTEKQKLYMQCIMATMEEPEQMIGVTLLTKEDNQMDEMIDFLSKNRGLSDEEILKKALEINQPTEK